MTEKLHLLGKAPCPFLPEAETVLSPAYSRELRELAQTERVKDYYLAALTCAQSLWLQGKPAQALLQLNHALSVTLDGAFLQKQSPYRAKRWIIAQSKENEFLGNPVRHYQHLATRVSGMNRELRGWRAWACFHIAKQVLSSGLFPRDFRQIEKENIIIPTLEVVLKNLQHITSPDEAAEVELVAGSEFSFDLRD